MHTDRPANYHIVLKVNLYDFPRSSSLDRIPDHYTRYLTTLDNMLKNT